MLTLFISVIHMISIYQQYNIPNTVKFKIKIKLFYHGWLIIR